MIVIIIGGYLYLLLIIRHMIVIIIGGYLYLLLIIRHMIVIIIGGCLSSVNFQPHDCLPIFIYNFFFYHFLVSSTFHKHPFIWIEQS